MYIICGVHYVAVHSISLQLRAGNNLKYEKLVEIYKTVSTHFGFPVNANGNAIKSNTSKTW